MANRHNGMRTCVMIVEQDVNVGLALANWLAARGYQAVLVRSVEAALEELRDICPQVVFVGRGHCEPAAQIGLSELLLLLQTVCPGVPVITIADQTSEDLTHVVFRQGVRHLLVKPVEFTQVSHVRRSALSSAPAEVASSGAPQWTRDRCVTKWGAHESTAPALTGLLIGGVVLVARASCVL